MSKDGVQIFAQTSAERGALGKIPYREIGGIKKLETASSSVDGFEIGDYDYIALTYVAAGNGVGEIETATYKDGGASGTTKATLTLAYNADNGISSITKV